MILTRYGLILLAGVLLAGTAHSWDRKGRLMQRSAKPMTMRSGSVSEPKSHSLTIKKTEQGLLLHAERRLSMDDHRVEIGYLAYDPDKEDAGLKIVSEPGPGCYWKTRSGTGHTRYLSILEIEHLQIPVCAMAGWELREKDGKLLVIKPDSDTYKQSAWVGAVVEYDNLDDGK